MNIRRFWGSFTTYRCKCVLSLAVIVSTVACGGYNEDPSNLEAGESLFELLDGASIISYPATNLPEDVVNLLNQPFMLRSRTLHAEEWEWVDNSTIPSWINKANARYGGLTYRAAYSPIPHSLIADSVRVYIQGDECQPWHMDTTDFPGLFAWWSWKDGLLFSLSSLMPEGISMRSLCVPGPGIEPTGLWGARPGQGQMTPKPHPRDLAKNVDMGHISRRSLILPAPGVISFPIGKLRCDELRLAVGVVDQCYRIVETDLEQSRGLSDGVTFQVRIVKDGHLYVVWQNDILHHELGSWRGEVSIDLSKYVGENITIQLATEPGANGNADYDYAVWGGLRLYGNPEGRPERPHLVIIDIDTLRKDRLGCFGYERGTSPNIDKWAAERAVVYRNCQATAPWTLPSTVSILTGLSVDQHLVDRFPANMEMRVPALALYLANSGYETFGIAESGYMAGSYGFDLGFDLYDCTMQDIPDWDKALSWIRTRRSEKPFFLFCHTYMVHAPYQYDQWFQDPNEPYTGRWAGQDITYQNVITPFIDGRLELADADKIHINDLYDAGIFRMDEYVGSFIESLDKLMDNEPYAIFFTSDHGEEFFEHGKMGHGQSLFRELLDVPLVVQYPRRGSGWETGIVDYPVSTLDIMPTILDLAHIQIPKECLGHSLLQARSENAIRIARQNSNIHSITVDNHKLIVNAAQKRGSGTPALSLYDLAEDPMEKINIAYAQGELAKKLAHLLKESLRNEPTHDSSESTDAIRTKTTNRLRALGYLQ